MHHCTICEAECDCDDVASGEGPCCHCDAWTGDEAFCSLDDGYEDGYDGDPPEFPYQEYLQGYCDGVIEREEWDRR